MDSCTAREVAVSELVGGLVGEYLGHGPKTRTYLNGDVITVVLEGALTKGEERLVRDGMSELVLSMRSEFQRTMRTDLIARVEGMTGRRVRVSANHMEPDIAVEVLVLDGASGGDPVEGPQVAAMARAPLYQP
ncbi:MAG TPA: Na-translocating system protein MpsC family protein [Solirubrobacteraceae bacterium]